MIRQHTPNSPMSNLPMPPLLAPNTLPTSPSDKTSIPSINANCCLKVLHLNCGNRILTTHEVLTHTHYNIIALQEPWVNPTTLRPPSPAAWTLHTSFEHTPTNYLTRHLVYIYISVCIPTAYIHLLPAGSDIFMAVKFTTPGLRPPYFKLLACYNPPTSIRGLPVVEKWLINHNDHACPTLLMMDTNLHHRFWSATHTRRFSPQAGDFVQNCCSASFKLISPRGEPTRFSKDTQPTVIDLVWANWPLTKKVVSCVVLPNNFGSDHQPISTVFDLTLSPPPLSHNNASLNQLIHQSFCTDVQTSTAAMPIHLDSPEDLDKGETYILNALLHAFYRQGKEVPTKPNRHKAWWDPKSLNPILRQRNLARRWMMRANLEEAYEAYFTWHMYFKQEVLKAKATH